MVLVVVQAASAGPAQANWLTKIVKEAGEAGGETAARTGKIGSGALDNVATHLKSLPDAPGTTAVAAHVGPEGHWHFANRSGNTFTAGNADELGRMRQAMAPDTSGGKLALYLTSDTIFSQRAMLKDLPSDADLFVVEGGKSYRLVPRKAGTRDTLFADFGSGLLVDLPDQKLFTETLFQLGQRLKPSSVRVLSLSPGGPDALNRVPRFDSATKSALVDEIDPQSLVRALPSVSGQTVIVTGRLEGELLSLAPSSGSQVSLRIAELRAAADAADVNLVIVRSASARQPGGRNWLWQKVEVSGLESALKQPTFGEFLSALGAKSGPMTVSAAEDGFGRVVLRAVSDGGVSKPLTGQLEDWMNAISGSVIGNVPVDGIDAHVRNEDRQQELDLRLIPGIPSGLQIGYIVGLVMGILGLGNALLWWRRIWPPEARDDYGGAIGYNAARVTRWTAFGLVFLPLAGPFAFVWLCLQQIWSIVTAPWRFLKWVFGRSTPTPGGIR